MISSKEHFVITYYSYAKKAEKATGIPALFALAQSALETGWGKSIKGNMLFGMKKGLGKNYGGWNGMTQWITTTEYANSPNKMFPVILEGYPKQLSSGRWKYKIKDEFRAYPNAYYSIIDWAGLLMQTKRYKNALTYKENPYQFASAIARAGYATDPNYEPKIHNIIRSIESIIKERKIERVTHKAALPVVLIAFVGILFLAALVNRIKEE